MARYDLEGRLVESFQLPVEALGNEYRGNSVGSFDAELQQAWRHALESPSAHTKTTDIVIQTNEDTPSPSFDTAAFVRDAALVYLQLQTRPYGNEIAHQNAIDSFKDVVATVLPAKERAIAKSLLAGHKKQILKLNMPGDQKALVLQRLADVDRAFPAPPPVQAILRFGSVAKTHTSEALRPRTLITAVALTAFSSVTVAQNAAAGEIVVIDTDQSSEKPSEQQAAKDGRAQEVLVDKAGKATTVTDYLKDALGFAPSGTDSNSTTVSESAVSSTAPKSETTTSVTVAPAVVTSDPIPEQSAGISDQDNNVAPDVSATTEADIKSDETQSTDMPASTQTEPPQSAISVPQAFTEATGEERESDRLLGDILNFFGTQGKELQYNPGDKTSSGDQSASVIMAAASVALNDPTVLTERDASLLPAEANTGVFGALPGAGAVIEQVIGDEPKVDETIQLTAASAYATTMEKIASEIGAGPTVPLAEETDEKPQVSAHNNEDGPTTSQEKLTKKEAQIKALHELAKADPTNWKNRAYVMEYLLEHTGLNIIQISGMIGNFCKEVGNCRLDPGTHQVEGPAIGIAQWDSRKEELLAFAKEKGMPWDSIELQAMFIVHELKGKEGLAYSKLLKAKTLEEAANVTLNFYERPAARILAPRLAYAKKTYNRFMRTYIRINNDNAAETTQKKAELPYEAMIDGAAKHYKLKASHGGKTGLLKPTELEKVGEAWGDNKLIPEAAEAFRLMNNAFKKEFGRDISIGNSYRTLERQKEMAGPMAAKVGDSRHGSGIAIDLGEANDDWGEKTREWINNEGWKYGWVNPLWAQKGASSKYEPWHIEFLGSQAMRVQIVVVKYQLKGHKDGVKVPQKLIEELDLAA